MTASGSVLNAFTQQLLREKLQYIRLHGEYTLMTIAPNHELAIVTGKSVSGRVIIACVTLKPNVRVIRSRTLQRNLSLEAKPLTLMVYTPRKDVVDITLASFTYCEYDLLSYTFACEPFVL